MTTINLKDYYPWYLTNEYIEVPDEVAAELRAGKLAEAAHAERVRYNKAYFCRIRMSETTSVPAFPLKVLFGKRIAPSRSAR